MKRFFTIFAIVLLFVGCQPGTVTVEVPVDYSDDPRLEAVGSASAIFVRYPVSSSRGIASGDPIAAECDEPGWAYIFYDDHAVIGYEPFPENISVMQAAVALTVESHNMEFPDKPWDYINVPPTPPPVPVTSNDPILGVWQVALCLDDGTIVMGPYTAEFDFNWSSFRVSVQLEMENYNRDHPTAKAHAVWGSDK